MKKMTEVFIPRLQTNHLQPTESARDGSYTIEVGHITTKLYKSEHDATIASTGHLTADTTSIAIMSGVAELSDEQIEQLQNGLTWDQEIEVKFNNDEEYEFPVPK